MADCRTRRSPDVPERLGQDGLEPGRGGERERETDLLALCALPVVESAGWSATSARPKRISARDMVVSERSGHQPEDSCSFVRRR